MIRGCFCWVLFFFIAQLVAFDGSIEVIDEINGPPAQAEAIAQLQQLEQKLAARLTQIQADEPPKNRALYALRREDILAIETDIKRVRLQMGGTNEIGRRRYWFKDTPLTVSALVGSQARIRLDEPPAFAVADWQEGTVGGYDRWGSFETARSLASVEPLKSSTKQAGKVLGLNVLSLAVSVDGEQWQVEYSPSLPNPFASLLTSDLPPKHPHRKLAQVPGCPMRIIRPVADGSTIVTRVVAVERDVPADDRFEIPR